MHVHFIICRPGLSVLAFESITHYHIVHHPSIWHCTLEPAVLGNAHSNPAMAAWAGQGSLREALLLGPVTID